MIGMTSISKVITGGQTGADQGALHAAAAAGIPTGGWAPRGWLTEAGPEPLLAEFGLQEHSTASYAARTKRNASEATGCLWFGNPHSPGGRCTMQACVDYGLDVFVVISESTPAEVADWIRGCLLAPASEPVVLMVAGNRESKSPGIGSRVEQFLAEVFDILSAGESA